MRRGLILSVLFGVGLILLTGLTGSSDGVDPLAIQDNAIVPAGALTGAQTIGQTFVFHYPRLSAIQVRWIVSDDLAFADSSRIVLRLRRAGASADLATASLALSDLRNDEFAKFVFPPIPDSQNQAFYFFLDAAQAEITRGYVSVWASGEDAYPDGAMNLAGQRTDRDLVFRAYYEPDLVFLLQALQTMVAQYWIALAFVLLVPLGLGLALGGFFWRYPADFDWIETVTLASGLGLACLSAASVLVLAFAISIETLAALVALIFVGGWIAILLQRRARPLTTYQLHFRDFSWTLAALILLSLSVGLVQMRDLPAPLWVDSPTHAGIIQRIVTSAPLPAGIFYHVGFHTVAALLVRWSGLAIPLVMWLLGQALITLIGLGVFLLGKRLSGSAWAGLAGAVCVWFLAPTPAYWITWGRYPLLLGAALLPLALFWTIELIESPRGDARVFCFAALTCAGMTFAHFRLILVYAVFVAVYLAFGARQRSALARVSGVFAASGLLGLLWLAALFTRNVSAQDLLMQNAGAQMIDVSTAATVWLSHHGLLVLALAALGAIVAFVQRSRVAAIALAWFAILFLIAALPPSIAGGGLVAPSFVMLLGFFPTALLIGELARAAQSWRGTSTRVRAGFAAVVGIVSLFGARDMVNVVNPATILYTQSDERAMAWIQEHTPADARFLVNSFDWFGGAYAPTDGGTWIPIIAKRPIVFPDSKVATDDPAALARWMDAQRITHIYLGRRAGVLDKTTFACQPERYTPIYYQAGIAIFAVRDGAAAAPAEVLLPFDCGK